MWVERSSTVGNVATFFIFASSSQERTMDLHFFLLSEDHTTYLLLLTYLISSILASGTSPLMV